MQLADADDFLAQLHGQRIASNRYRVRCSDCGRILCVARVLPGAGQVDYEWVRFRPDANGETRAVTSRPKVKWKKLPDGRTAVRCPCGMGAILSGADLEAAYRRAVADGAENIVLGAR